MNEFLELVKIILPAALVLYAMYLTTKTMMQKELKEKAVEYQIETNKTTLPLRLQAYERLSLFLERIAPGSLLLRLNEPGLDAKTFQHLLIREIRDELNHNLSQQVYISNEAWNNIKGATEELITLINSAGEQMPEDAKSTALAKEIVSRYVAKDEDPVNNALVYLKNEVKELF